MSRTRETCDCTSFSTQHDDTLARAFRSDEDPPPGPASVHLAGTPEFVKHYCKSCTICAPSQAQHHKPYGLLKQPPVPEKPWNLISMDFIEKLPPSSGYTSILVIVDRLSKQLLFIPTHDTITSSDLAQLFVIHVFSKARRPIPCNIQSGLGVRLALLPVPSARHGYEATTSPWDIIWKVTDRPSTLIRPWKQVHLGSIAITSRTTGPASFHWPSSHITTPRV